MASNVRRSVSLLSFLEMNIHNLVYYGLVHQSKPEVCSLTITLNWQIERRKHWPQSRKNSVQQRYDLQQVVFATSNSKLRVA
jgi:hypothetical protein